MADTTVTLEQEQSFTVTTQQESLTTTTSTLTNPSVVESMDFVGDVDTASNGKINGSLLVYRTTTNKWTSTTQLDAQNLEGGFF
jgi:hypothetical protein